MYRNIWSFPRAIELEILHSYIPTQGHTIMGENPALYSIAMQKINLPISSNNTNISEHNKHFSIALQSGKLCEAPRKWEPSLSLNIYDYLLFDILG